MEGESTQGLWNLGGVFFVWYHLVFVSVKELLTISNRSFRGKNGKKLLISPFHMVHFKTS